ncbi:uncharacterized protein LOC113170074 isoform X2 [Anabas testudineus]|uniref:uncharacterized protein LOC113170074 isoform X2 n=1 Tax=Anabas testudineus TaxID=64144 RepID=UPI000E45CFD2|nr:uncharacterized protein LOC113170074 isoform X2 [Anabas testudineus]
MNVAVSVDPQNVTEGSSVNLTCSCEANPAADNYTWYKRTDSPGSSSLLQVGSGQVLSLLSVDPSHAGVYLCQVMNSLGENKSTELLLTMEKKEPGIQPLPVLAGVGVLLVTLVVAVFFFFWRKRQLRAEEKPVFDFRLSVRGSSSSAFDHQSDSVYANVHMLESSPLAVTNAQDLTSASQSNLNHNHDVCTSPVDEVHYSTVTIKPRNPSLPHHINNSRTPQNTWSVGDNSNTVIYATVAKSNESD